MEQKLVQRCETKVDADACKASYAMSSSALSSWALSSCVLSSSALPEYVVLYSWQGQNTELSWSAREQGGQVGGGGWQDTPGEKDMKDLILVKILSE